MKFRITVLAFGVVVVIIALFAFYRFGDQIWRPYYVKLTGGRTVEEVVEGLRAKGLGVDRELLEPLDGLVLLGLKEEKMLEVWGKRKAGGVVKITVFPFTGFSGGPGPKLREGDRQIPEGVYGIEYLNPNSRFHLSMKIDYPNAFDRARGREDGRQRLGDDIFIHGRSATIGCIPIGDDAIEELFLLVVEVGRENVTVILSPYDFREERKAIVVDEITWASELYALIESAKVRHGLMDD